MDFIKIANDVWVNFDFVRSVHIRNTDGVYVVTFSDGTIKEVSPDRADTVHREIVA